MKTQQVSEEGGHAIVATKNQVIENKGATKIQSRL
jgi:hypothetical protein